MTQNQNGRPPETSYPVFPLPKEIGGGAEIHLSVF